MEIDIQKRNLLFIIVFMALGILAIIIGYAINSKKEELPSKIEVIEEKQIDTDTEELLDDREVKELFKIYSALDTKVETMYLPSLDKDSKFPNEETKLYLAASMLSTSDRYTISCSEIEFDHPSTFKCKETTYYLSVGDLTEQYVYLFGMDKQLPKRDFSSYMYDNIYDRFVYFYVNSEEEYSLPRAKIDSSYKENGNLIIIYHLDYSSVGGSNNKNVSIKLTFKYETSTKHYIFSSKETTVE